MLEFKSLFFLIFNVRRQPKAIDRKLTQWFEDLESELGPDLDFMVNVALISNSEKQKLLAFLVENQKNTGVRTISSLLKHMILNYPKMFPYQPRNGVRHDLFISSLQAINLFLENNDFKIVAMFQINDGVYTPYFGNISS